MNNFIFMTSMSIMVAMVTATSFIVSAEPTTIKNEESENSYEEQRVKQTVQNYSVGLSSTRVIYKQGSKGSVVIAENKNDYPVLVQSTIEPGGPSDRNKTPFIVTPPLFRLEANSQSAIRIIKVGDESFNDRESLYWFCAMAIPPGKDSAWNEKQANTQDNDVALDIKVRTNRCIKLIERPSSLNEKPEGVVSSIVWIIEGDEIKAHNPTGYYISLSSIALGGKVIDTPNYIPPMGSSSYKVPHGVKVSALDDIYFTIINDLGGDSGPYKARLN